MLSRNVKKAAGDNLTARSINLIIDRIRSGELKRGEQLPPQDEMARSLGVSRTAYREALKELSYRGIIDSRHGHGTFICDKMVEENETLEARLILEPPTARLATQRGDEPDFRRLSEMCEVMALEVQAGDGQAFSKSDLQFHGAIAAMSRNQALCMLFASVQDMTLHQLNVVHIIPGTMERAYIYHQEITRAMAMRQAELAKEAMERHLEDVITTLQAWQFKEHAMRKGQS